MAESLSFCILTFSTLVRRKHEVSVDDHTDRKAGPDSDRRLDIEIAAHDLVQAVGAATSERRDDGTVVIGSAKLRADAEHRGERGCHDQPSPVMIDLVLETGKPL